MSRVKKSLRQNKPERDEIGFVESGARYSHLNHREHRSNRGRKKYRYGDHSAKYDKAMRDEGKIVRLNKINR